MLLLKRSWFVCHSSYQSVLHLVKTMRKLLMAIVNDKEIKVVSCNRLWWYKFSFRKSFQFILIIPCGHLLVINVAIQFKPQKVDWKCVAAMKCIAGSRIVFSSSEGFEQEKKSNVAWNMLPLVGCTIRNFFSVLGFFLTKFWEAWEKNSMHSVMTWGLAVKCYCKLIFLFTWLIVLE